MMRVKWKDMNNYYFNIFIILLNVWGIYGMENNAKKYDIIQRKAAQYMVTKLLFRDNEKVLCIGYDYGKIKQKNSYIRRKIDYVDIFELGKHNTLLDYDKVLLFFSWNVTKEPKQIFIESACVLKSGGRLCGMLPYYQSLYLDIYYQTRAHNIGKNNNNKNVEITWYGSNQMKWFLKKAGFDQVESRKVNKSFTFKTKEEFIQWILNCPEQLVGIAKKHHRSFVNNVVDNYMKCCSIAHNQPIRLHFPYMIMSGYKI